MRNYIIIFTCLLFTLSACDRRPQSEIDEEVIQGYIQENNLDAIKTDDGFYYVVVEEGSGTETPDIDEVVELQYIGYLIDNEVFDRTPNDQKLKVELISLNPGWQEAIQAIKKGGTVTIIVPSEKGFGEGSTATVPENSVLIYDIVLADHYQQSAKDESLILAHLEENEFEAERTDEGLYYEIIEPGEGDVFPKEDAIITIKYKGTLLDGTVFDQTFGEDTATFALNQLIQGWQIGIPLLQKGGKIKLYIPSAIGYGSNGTGGIPPCSVLVFDIELLDFSL